MTDNRQVAGLVLAGGQSRRMGGREKSFLSLGGKPLIGHVLDRLLAQVDALVINANGDPARFAEFGYPVIADTVPGFAGPLAGVLAGMRWAQASHPAAVHLISVATDTPFFPADLASRLLAAVGGDEGTIAVAASAGNRHPVFACWPVTLADDLAAFLAAGEGGKVLAFAARHRLVEVAFEPVAVGGVSIDPFFNINAPAELELARKALEGAHDGAAA